MNNLSSVEKLKAAPETRRYQSIWKELKLSGRCVVQLPDASLFSRVKRGVIKEKSLDLAFALLNSSGDNFRLFIVYDEEACTIEFRLQQRLSIVKKEII